MTARVVGVLQARTGSSRFPQKVLADLAGKPLLARVVERARAAQSLDDLVVATTDRSRDDPIAALADELGVPSFRGSEDDCLDRFHGAAAAHDAGVVVRLTGDNPVLDGAFVDEVVAAYFGADPAVDYVSSVLDGTFPLGLGVEVFSREALAEAWAEAPDGAWREHVTPFFYKQPDRFRVLALGADRDYSGIRLTVDTTEDLELVRKIYAHFGEQPFSWREAVGLVESREDWGEGNRHVAQRNV